MPSQFRTAESVYIAAGCGNERLTSEGLPRFAHQTLTGICSDALQKTDEGLVACLFGAPHRERFAEHGFVTFV